MSGGHTREDFNDEMNDLERSLQKEKECVAFYGRSAEQVNYAQAKALFEWFVKAGQTRIAGLERIHTASLDSVSWAPEVKDQMQTADELVNAAPAFDVDDDAGDTPGKVEIMTIRQAVEMEKAVASIYHTAARRARDKNVREMWRYLAASEEAHKQLLDTYFDGMMQLAMKKKVKPK